MRTIIEINCQTIEPKIVTEERKLYSADYELYTKSSWYNLTNRRTKTHTAENVRTHNISLFQNHHPRINL